MRPFPGFEWTGFVCPYLFARLGLPVVRFAVFAAVARRFGFHGALVPGVEVYAYMAHMPVARWGRAWLESGAAECRFRKPVYDGAIARVTANEENGRLALTVESGSARCASGHAFM